MNDRPERQLVGLPPRNVTGDLSRMKRSNREPSPMPLAAPIATPASAEKTKPKRITVYVDQDVFSRARGAYRKTSHLEDDKTWSQFVEKALAAEAERREAAHNGGKQFDGETGALPSGRPISDD
ncbi:hypothetical protein B2J88_48965 [Rhodococcus sp. SRB_17]|nr:hypothetical protein [Rhodococcus sp. SRB_17]